MARGPYEGTPPEWRSKGYVLPSRQRPVLRWSIVAAVLLVVLLIGGHFAGAKRTLSPGDLASHHARIDLKCSRCHETGNEIAAVRCERCHDPSGSERLAHAAHVLLGSGDARKAEQAEQTACATCHVEHRGLAASVRAVDDRECATCHLFSTLAGHPEFAAVRARATAGVGLKFNHDRHLVEAQNARGASCATCHEQTADRAAFAPVSFERHCASCHLQDGAFGETDPVLPELLVAPANLPVTWSSRTAAELQPRGRKVAATGLRHRDGWVLFNALRVRQSIDPDDEVAERLALRARIAYLEQLQGVQPVHQASAEELEVAESILEQEVADLRQRAATEASNASDEINEMLEAARGIGRQMESLDPAAAEVAAQPAAQGPSSADTPEDPTRFEQRKTELLKLLATVSSRVADGNLRERAEALRAQIERLSAGSGDGGASDTTVLVDRLADLDEVVTTLKATPDAGVQSLVAQIDLLRIYGRQRMLGGLSAADFETRKAELLALLDAIERRGGPVVRPRAAALRQRVIALEPGTTGLAELTRGLRQRQKQLERVRLELELLQSPDDYEPPPRQDARADLPVVERTLQRLRAQLADTERAPRMSAAQSPEEREQRRNELDALLSRCLKCHDYDPSGVRLAAVRAAEPVMPRSVFNHAPHTTQTPCETCHASTRSSKLATDVNVPGVASCRSCHGPSQARAECETCHVYHPQSPAHLLAVTR